MSRAALVRLFATTFAFTIGQVKAGELYVDGDYGFRVAAPGEKWQRAAVPVQVLGEPCRVWAEDNNPTHLIVAFVRMANPPSEMDERGDKKQSTEGESAGQAAAERLSRRLQGIAQAVNAEVLGNKTLELADRSALSFRFSGKGHGSGIDGKGSVPTTQHWYAFPRGRETIVLLGTAPAAEFDEVHATLERMLPTVKIEARRPAAPPSREYVDKQYGIRIPYPEASWIRGGYELGDFVVPGEVCRIWSAPSTVGFTADRVSRYACRLALFVQKPGRAFTPRFLLDSSANGMKQALDVQVLEQDVRQVAGMQAMWLLVEGKSRSGAKIEGRGDIPTRQLWVAIPRQEDIVVLLLNAPAADFGQSQRVLQTMLDKLQLSGTQTPEQKESQ